MEYEQTRRSHDWVTDQLTFECNKREIILGGFSLIRKALTEKGSNSSQTPAGLEEANQCPCCELE